MRSNLFLRIVSALILAPIVLCPIWFGKSVYEEYGIPLYPILLVTLGTGLAWEWGEMFQKKGSANQLMMALTAGLVAFMSISNPTFGLWLILLGTTLIAAQTQAARVLVAVVYFYMPLLAVQFESSVPLLIAELILFFLSILMCLGSKQLKFALGVPYICLPILALGYIYYINENISREIVLWLIFVVWATDVGGFVVGKTVGGPKLAPKISAKKTWSGLIGAILFAMAVAYVFALYLKAHGIIVEESYLTRLVLSAGVLAVIAQVGDFFESAIKRKLGLKDSSNLIPGHGGLFDRVDGLLFASMATALVLAMINNGWFM